jgi:tRNA(adenine34) deaminase
VPERYFPLDEHFMRLAIREGERALEHDDVPVGAVVVLEGEVLGAAHNERELRADPTCWRSGRLRAHADSGGW